MSQPTVSREVTVLNPQGLHARPAHQLVQRAMGFESEILLAKDGTEVDGKSILNVLMLGAECGSRLTITARGGDSEAALSALQELFERGFHEDSHETSPTVNGQSHPGEH